MNVIRQWLLYNAKAGIFQLYRGKNKLVSDEMMILSVFVLDQHANLPRWHKSKAKHVAPLEHIFMTLKSINLCSFFLMLLAQWGSSKY